MDVAVKEAYEGKLWEHGELHTEWHDGLRRVMGIEKRGTVYVIFTKDERGNREFNHNENEVLIFFKPTAQAPTIADLLERIEALEARVKALENRSAMYRLL